MTSLGGVILAGLVAVQTVEWVAEWLNLRSLSPTLPPGFDDVYPADTYARAQDYARAKARFGFFSSAVKGVAMVTFWLAGGFAWSDGLARSAGCGSLATGLLFFAILYLLGEILQFPLSVYATFSLEQRFGFNRTTVGTFLGDRLKGFLLTVALGGPLAGLLLWFFGSMGNTAWLWAWGAVGGWTLVIQFLAPTWILPLFNRFTPLPDGDLKTAIFNAARKAGYPLTNVFVMDGSKRSSKGNAFFTGFGKNKRIALFDTLVEKHTVPELVAVLAHEIGHHKKGHVWKGFVLSLLQTGVLLWGLSCGVRETALCGAFGMSWSVHGAFAAYGLLLTPLTFFLSLPLNALSRRREYEADRFAADTLGSGRDLVSGLKKLSADSLANLTPHPMYVMLHHSHPPLVQRVHALD